MGKIINDGATFVAYANSRLIRKVDDIPELKHALIALGESKSHRALSEYALLLAEHILDIGKIERSETIDACFTIVKRWQEKEVRFQDALLVAGALNDLAREERDPVKAKGLRALGQVAATPHVRWHALVASEYAIVMINILYPKDFDKVRRERAFQIGLMKDVG